MTVICTSTQCVIVSVPLRVHCLTQCYMVLYRYTIYVGFLLHRPMNFVSYLRVLLLGYIDFVVLLVLVH